MTSELVVDVTNSLVSAEAALPEEAQPLVPMFWTSILMNKATCAVLDDRVAQLEKSLGQSVRMLEVMESSIANLLPAVKFPLEHKLSEVEDRLTHLFLRKVKENNLRVCDGVRWTLTGSVVGDVILDRVKEDKTISPPVLLTEPSAESPKEPVVQENWPRASKEEEKLKKETVKKKKKSPSSSSGWSTRESGYSSPKSQIDYYLDIILNNNMNSEEELTALQKAQELKDKKNLGTGNFQMEVDSEVKVKRAKKPLTCYRCGKEGHIEIGCKEVLNCAHCGGNHNIDRCWTAKNPRKKGVCHICGEDADHYWRNCPKYWEDVELCARCLDVNCVKFTCEGKKKTQWKRGKSQVKTAPKKKRVKPSTNFIGRQTNERGRGRGGFRGGRYQRGA
jgi:hypothetical protein